MTSSTLPDSTSMQNTSMVSGSPGGVFVSHRFLRTEPRPHFHPRTETRPAEVITWEPVILPLLERLAGLRALPEEQRWPGADWPNDEAFLDAGKFTEQLPVPLKAVPHISLADDGEVNFTWSQDGIRIDLGFYGTGAFSYYAREKDGREWFGDDLSVKSSLPGELHLLLAR